MDVLKTVFVYIIVVCFMTLFFPLTFVVWLLVFPFDRKRAVTHWFLVFQSFILVKILPVWRAEISGRKNIIRGRTYVIVSNHQSMLDILFLNCILYRYKWISKIENRKVPFIGWYLKMADYITVDRGDDESKAAMLQRSLECLRGGTSIMIFPEGTRSLNKNLGFFRRGGFQLATEAGVPILPIVIDGTGDILPKHGFLMGSGYRIRVRILEPVFPDRFSSENPDELARYFQAYLGSQLEKMRERK